jgi:hypothetical protein
MRLSELAERWKKDRRTTELSLVVPVLLLERLGERAKESWEQTGAIFVSSLAERSDPRVFFVDKAARTGNAFPMGVTIGRVESNDIVIDDPGLSRFHAWLQHDVKKGQWLLCDAESKNGTQLDDAPVASGAKVPLRDGSVITLGQVSLRFLLPTTLIELLRQ